MQLISEKFETESGNCTIPANEQMYIAVTVQNECINEMIKFYRVEIYNTVTGVCAKKFAVTNIALHDNIYDWRTPYFKLPVGKYGTRVQLSGFNCNAPPGTPYAQNGQVLQEVTC